MTPTNIVTHLGWFFACPVYIGATDSDAPLIVPRRFIPEWWLTVNDWAFCMFVVLVQLVRPDFDPYYPIKVTGDVDPPLVLE